MINNITVVGIGYVGLASAVMLASKKNVILLDIDKNKIQSINNRISPLADVEIETEFASNNNLNLVATSDEFVAYRDADCIIVATPTDYNTDNYSFDTTTVDRVIKQAMTFNKHATIVIKSTVPIGYVDAMRNNINRDKILCPESNRIIFSPEFLREGMALKDNLYPSRIIVGDTTQRAIDFANLLKFSCKKPNVEILLTQPHEAEAIKLFSNTYLAMRVAFFNELDSYAMQNDLDTKQILQGVCLDPRIGTHYNNPSFGYGGYCLPKDTKQLVANFQSTPQKLMTAIVESNDVRKNYIVSKILQKKPSTVGIYRLIMKAGSDNFRAASIVDIMMSLKRHGVNVVVYEPNLDKNNKLEFTTYDDLDVFANKSNIIIANRKTIELIPYTNKVMTRDLFGADI